VCFAYSNGYADFHADSDGYLYADSDGDGNLYANTYSYCDSYGYGDGNLNADTNPASTDAKAAAHAVSSPDAPLRQLVKS
jgi:hypothetical protein